MKKVFSLGLIAMFSVMCVLLTGCGRSNSQIAEEVTPLVDKLLVQADCHGAKCEKVVNIVKDKEKKDTYTAKAMVSGGGFSEGQFLNIKIEYSDDMVFVTILE